MFFLVMYIIINVISAIFIIYETFENDNVFIYPRLVKILREDLNIPGTIIVTTLFSIFFAPAIIFYFVFIGILMGIISFCALLKHIFRRRD